jgi:hypothetical protein
MNMRKRVDHGPLFQSPSINLAIITIRRCDCGRNLICFDPVHFDYTIPSQNRLRFMVKFSDSSFFSTA